MMTSFRKIEPFSLAKLQLFQTFSNYCSIMHSNLTSKVPNLVEIEHFTVKKQLTASRSRQLGGVVNQFVGVSKYFARASLALTPLSSNPVSAPVMIAVVKMVRTCVLCVYAVGALDLGSAGNWCKFEGHQSRDPLDSCIDSLVHHYTWSDFVAFVL